MTIDASLLPGRDYAPQRYEVAREKIREFADAIGDTNAAYREPDAARALGHEDAVAPPTFAMIPVLRGFDTLVDDLGIEYSQVIHVDQRFEHQRPIRAGDTLLTSTRLENVRSRAGNHFLTVRSDIATDAGEPVCVATATLLVRPEEQHDD